MTHFKASSECLPGQTEKKDEKLQSEQSLWGKIWLIHSEYAIWVLTITSYHLDVMLYQLAMLYRMTVNDNSRKCWLKDLTCFTLISKLQPGRSEENHKTSGYPFPEWDWNFVPYEWKSDMSSLYMTLPASVLFVWGQNTPYTLLLSLCLLTSDPVPVLLARGLALQELSMSLGHHADLSLFLHLTK